MIRTATALMTVCFFMNGCVYYNSIYNAEQAYDQAEAHRRAGRDSLAAASYQDVIRKAAEGYRRDPEGQWAPDALFLLGRARLRMGETGAAQAAFETAEALAEEPGDSLAILVYRAVAAEQIGDREGALRLVNRALGGLSSGPALADGHLLRGRILLEEGQRDGGWWDLDRAPSVDAGTRVEAGLARLRWAVELDEPRRASEALTRLLKSSEAAPSLDSVAVLAHAAALQWGPSVVAGFLAGADSADWGRVGRARIRLTRAVLLEQAGDTAAASQAAWAVARGIGEGAGEARLWLAKVRLVRARDLAELAAVRGLLLPAGEQPAVGELVELIDEVDRLTALGLEESLGWFAAGEIARDDLQAPILSRGLFLAYADADPREPWAAKALLAAIDVSPGEGDRAWLRGRLEVHRESPYVLAARGSAAPGFEALEEDLALLLQELRNR